MSAIGVVLFAVAPAPVAVRLTPNEGVHSTARNALLLAAGAGLLFAAIALVFGAMGDGGSEETFATSWVTGLFATTVVGLVRGGMFCLQHFAVRFCLRLSSFAPLRYARFLDYAADRNILQKVGGGYQFVHDMVLEHLGDAESA